MKEEINIKNCRLDVGSMELFSKKMDELGVKKKENLDPVAIFGGIEVFKNILVPKNSAWLIDKKTGKIIQKFDL